MGLCNKRTRWQYIAALTGCIMGLGHGMTLGWFSPILPILFFDNNPFGDPLTISQASWAGAVVGLGSLLANLIICWPVDRFGRKPCMYIVAIPNVINWILVSIGGHVACLYVARFLVGFSGGTLMIVIPIFISEIADDNVRGTQTSLFILTMSIGLSLGLIMATYISYYVLPFIIGALPIIFMLVIIPLPQSPYFLLKHGREEKAEKSFYFYKNLGGKTSSDPAKQADAKVEYNTFREEVLGGGITQKTTCRDFCSKAALEAFGLICILLLSNTFSGSFAILNYASTIFSALGSKMEPNTCATVVGVTLVLGISCAVLLVDHVGRRWLLIPSLVAAGLGELSVGLLTSLASPEFLSETGWLGLTLICFVEYMTAIGVISVTFGIIIELLPIKIHSVGVSLCVASYSTFIFVVLYIYPMMIADYGLSSVMYMSASFCIFGAVVLGIFLPETKGRKLT